MPAGRPRIYTDPQLLSDNVDAYFESIEPVEEKDDEGNVIGLIGGEPPTVTGLALYLGFSSKDSLYDYRDRKEFSDSIKRGLAKIEQHHEKSLNKKACTGHIFALKNMGWADRSEVKTITDTPSEEALDKRLKELGLLD